MPLFSSTIPYSKISLKGDIRSYFKNLGLTNGKCENGNTSNALMTKILLDYDIQRYNFHDWARNVLGTKELENAHCSRNIKNLNRSPTVNQLAESSSDISEKYHSLISDFLSEIYGEISTYQSPPSFRFHYIGLGCSIFHTDRDFGVEQGRMNVWVPLTDVWGSNSLWIESEEGAGDYAPVSMHLGQALIFDGVNIGHGSKINTTSASRISFDFRFEPGPGPATPTSY